MSALKNAKHEAFAQLTIRGTKYGWSQADIYQRAGFRASGHSAEVSASRLMKKPEIRRRLDELAAPAVKKAKVTVESLLAELEANIVGATAAQQHGAVNGAIMLMGKLRGLLIDRVEVGGVGEFDQCNSAEDVIDKLLGEQDPQDALDMLDVMRAMVLERASNGAQVVEPARRQIDEASRSIELLRPRRR
jgi:hypothetical protein